MLIVSHRGLIKGPNEYRENNPIHLDKVIAEGYCLEVDIRFSNDKFWLGHDKETYEVDVWWILERKNSIIFHCKNIEAASRLRRLDVSINYFGHASDSFVAINNGLLWVHSIDLPLNEYCIIPLIDDKAVNEFKLTTRIAGICTDYVELAQKKYGD